jgi:multimeric flavodoxin WrbA
MRTTIALFASSRRYGNTGKLIDEIAGRLGIEVVDLGEQNISTYDYDHRNRHDDFEPLLRRLLAFDQIIFASPEYWYAVSPPLKAFLDRISDVLDLPDLKESGRLLRTKTAYVVCTSASDEPSPPFMDAFRATFRYLGIGFGGYVHANCSDGGLPSTLGEDIERFVKSVRDA